MLDTKLIQTTSLPSLWCDFTSFQSAWWLEKILTACKNSSNTCIKENNFIWLTKEFWGCGYECSSTQRHTKTAKTNFGQNHLLLPVFQGAHIGCLFHLLGRLCCHWKWTTKIWMKSSRDHFFWAILEIWLFCSTSECDCCIHRCPNGLSQRGNATLFHLLLIQVWKHPSSCFRFLPDLDWLGMVPLSISCRSFPIRMASQLPSFPRYIVSTTLNTSPLVKLRPMGVSASWSKWVRM